MQAVVDTGPNTLIVRDECEPSPHNGAPTDGSINLVLDAVGAVAALVAKRFGNLNWYEERPLCDGARAFADIDAGRTDMAKIVLRK